MRNIITVLIFGAMGGLMFYLGAKSSKDLLVSGNTVLVNGEKYFCLKGENNNERD